MEELITDLLQKLSITQYSIGSQHWVHVTHVNTPNDFYVRPTDNKDYLPCLRQYLQGPVEPSKLQLGSTVVFKSKTKKHHVRGQIRNIREESNKTVYDLFALDYGFFEQSVPVKNIKNPRFDCPMPATALQCQLADCQPKHGNVFDEKTIEAMVFYIGNERANMTIQGVTGGKFIVQLINTCPEDIATMMALTDYSCLGYADNIVSRMPTLDQPKLYYTYKQLKVGDTLNVRVQSGDSLQGFYVCDVKDHKEYNQELKNLKEYYHREKDFLVENLKSGKAVAVFSDWHSRYERAIIKDVLEHEKRAEVQLVDWGTKSDIYVGVTRLKALSREYYFLRPAMAIYCTAEEKQVWDNGLHRFLYPGYEFVITIKKLGHHLETPNVVTITKADKK